MSGNHDSDNSVLDCRAVRTQPMKVFLLLVTEYFMVVKCEILNAESQKFKELAVYGVCTSTWGGGGEVWTEWCVGLEVSLCLH
jgi:hypothetical protein